MTDRMDVLCPTPPNKEGKSFLNRVGIAFATKNGGWRVSLNSLPLPTLNDKGQLETTLLLMPPKEDTRQSAGGGFDRSDSVPF